MWQLPYRFQPPHGRGKILRLCPRASNDLKPDVAHFCLTQAKDVFTALVRNPVSVVYTSGFAQRVRSVSCELFFRVGKMHYNIPTLWHPPPSTGKFLFQFNNKETQSDAERPRFGSQASLGDKSSHWSEAGSPAPWLGSPSGGTSTPGTSVPEDQESAFRLDTGEKSAAVSAEEGGNIAEQNRIIGFTGGGREAMKPRGWRETNSEAAGGGQARMMGGDDVVHELPRDDTAFTGARLSSRGFCQARREQDAFSIQGDATAKSTKGTRGQRRSENGDHFTGMFASDNGRLAVAAGPGNGSSESRTMEQNSASKGGQTGRRGIGRRKALDRTPRVMTVSVKPKNNQPPSSTSPQEETSSALPQRQICQTGNTNAESDIDVSRQDDRVDGSEASLSTPSFVPRRNGIPSAERQAAGDNGQPSLEGGGANTESKYIERGPSSSGTKHEGTKNSASGLSGPVAAASQLGLEGDRFPDVSEFDLDDISEIDAYGEWVGSEGGASLSS